MQHKIDYYFTLLSPWTYIGHDYFVSMARRHGAAVAYRPTGMRSVIEETGGLRLAKRHPVRQDYRLVELQRWRDRRCLPLVLHPKYFPVDVSLADRVVLAICDNGGDPSAFMGDVLAGVWVRDEDLSVPEHVASLATKAGFDGAALLRQADGEAVRSAYAATSATAIEAGVFGAPSYVLNGEVFWGQDRLDLLEDAVRSGREAYRSDAAA